MPTVKLSNPLSAAYAERLGLAVREYGIGENIVVDVNLSQYLETVGYGIVTDDPSPGAPLLFGSGAPAAGLGVNGSYYLDTTNQRVYGPKTSGAWGGGVALTGSTTLLGGVIVAPKGDPGPKGDKGDPGNASSLALRSATDYDDSTAPTTGGVIRWNGSKFAPKVLAAGDVGAVATTGAETIAGVKTFSSAPVVAAGTAAGNPIRYDDTSRTNARTPTAHAASHATAGSDAISPSAIGAAASGHTHTAGSVGAASATHSHDASAITGGTLLLIDGLNLDDQSTNPTAPASGHTLWTPAGSTALQATGADNVVRRIKPIRAVTSWPPDSEVLPGDEAIIESTGDHRVYLGSAQGWRQISPLNLTAAGRANLTTSGLHPGFRVWETDTLRMWAWSGSLWVLIGGRKPFAQAAKYGSQSQSLPANSATIVLWPTLIAQTDASPGIWRGASVGGLYAPIDGYYELHTNMHLNNDGTAGVRWEVKARVNGTGTSQQMVFAMQRPSADFWSIGGMTPLPMTAGQYVEIIVVNNGAAASIGGFANERYITGVTLRWVNPLT